MKQLIFTAALCLGCSAASGEGGPDSGTPADGGSPTPTLEPTDVAVLFPLPASTASDTLLTVSASGAKGSLIPGWASDPLDNLTSGLSGAGAPQSNAELWPLLRVVAFNVDHCFPDGTVADSQPNACRRQIRLVFQPIVDAAAGGTSTDDVTVHVFYDLSSSEFATLVGELSALKRGAPAPYRAVGINPAMRAEHPGGPYAAAVQEILLRHCGGATLTKITFSALEGTGFGWHFGGFDYDRSQNATGIAIPATDYRDGTKKSRQELVNNPSDPSHFLATVDPISKFEVPLAVFLDSAAAYDAGSAELTAGLQASLQIDNPTTSNNPNTVDCVSCHLATPVRSWAARHLGIDAGAWPEAFTSHWNLESTSETADDTRATRCFGYFGDRVSISQRTINEAAAVTDYLNQHYLDGGVQ